jgi:hypothetical protein
LISEVVGIESDFIDYLEDTYLFDEQGEFKNCIFIKYESDFRNPDFTSYEYKLTNSSYFVKHVDIGNKVVYVFNFPEEYLPEYNHFINGEYSRFGEDAKILILHFWTQMYGRTASGINAILKIKQVLYRDKKLKQQIEERLSSEHCRIILDDNAELGDLVLLEDETFKLNDSDL